MSICDILNPWGALREARWLVASQKREIEALYVKLRDGRPRHPRPAFQDRASGGHPQAGALPRPADWPPRPEGGAEMIAEAREAFAQRDRLQAELDAVNNRLVNLKSQYMQETHIWGIRDERFRHEINKEYA